MASTSKSKRKPSMHKVAPPPPPTPPPPSYSAFFPGTTTTTTTEIPNDTVFYAIYPDDILQVNPSFISKPEYQQLISSFHSLHLRILDVVSSYTTNYIWQHEPFSLSLSSNPNPNCPCSPENLPHFHGKTKYGENLEDEWFIVFLLFQISRRISNITIRVWDSDGGFLLFECAEFLSSLHLNLNSANTQNRVFIRGGRLEIVPEELVAENTPLLRFLTGLAIGIGVGAPSLVQSVFRKRISDYPDRTQSNMHRVRVRVPVSVAKVLKHEPCLITLAVEGFCTRGTDSMKFIEKMEKFQSGGTGNEELVRVSVRMSRAMYAKLAQQTFDAPECYKMPPRTDSSAYVEAMLGMKIACGFEMMYQQRRNQGTEVKTKTWEDYKESLKSNGYFQDLLPKSKRYRRLSKDSREYYTKMSSLSRTREMMNAPVRRIDKILAFPDTAEKFKGLDLPPSDDDAWLYNGQDELKLAMLKRPKQMQHFEPKDIKGKKVAKKKGADQHFPANRDSNAMDPEIERFRKFMEFLHLSNEGTVGDADTEEGSSSDNDFGYGGVYDYGSDFSYDDFTNPFIDDDGNHLLCEELMYAALMNNFVHADEQSSDDEGTSSDEESEDELNPAEQPQLRSPIDSFPSQQGRPGSASTFLGLIGQQLPKDAKKGSLRKGK